MDTEPVVTNGVPGNALKCVAVALSLLAVAGCAAVQLRSPSVSDYDPNQGSTKEDIRTHFNLHRGRWWNYYRRGCVFLECEHYPEALSDFARAISKVSLDTRSARTYGMNFVQYFPHRESGIAFYRQAESVTDPTTQEALFQQAIAELKISLSQEESPRARYYLDEVTGASLKTTDAIPPTVRMKKPICTRERTVWVDIAVTDDQSGVKEIRIDKSMGDVRIDRPTLLVEPAEKEFTGKVELTIGPQVTMAVVVITASDAVGNESEPNSALIIIDTQLPSFLDIDIGETRPDGSVVVSVTAEDDFGLREIQLGEDRYNCNGAFRCSGTIASMPIDGELTVKVVDNAGNEAVMTMPIE